MGTALTESPARNGLTASSSPASGPRIGSLPDRDRSDLAGAAALREFEAAFEEFKGHRAAVCLERLREQLAEVRANASAAATRAAEAQARSRRLLARVQDPRRADREHREALTEQTGLEKRAAALRVSVAEAEVDAVRALFHLLHAQGWRPGAGEPAGLGRLTNEIAAALSLRLGLLLDDATAGKLIVAAAQGQRPYLPNAGDR